jgi:hypothetical protein
MQKATRKSLEVLKKRLLDTRDREWLNLTMDPVDSPAGQDNVATFFSIGNDYVSRLVDMLLDIEHNALSSDQSPKVDDDYFTGLADDILHLVQAEYRTIRDRAFIRFEHLPKDERAALSRDIDRLISLKCRSIIHTIEDIKADLKNKSSDARSAPSGEYFPPVSDAGILYSSIRARIRSLPVSEDGRFLKAFDHFLEEINQASLAGKEGLFLLQNVDFLLDQYAIPPERKNPGLINASLFYLASAANGAEKWLKYSPVIVAYFNKYL